MTKSKISCLFSQLLSWVVELLRHSNNSIAKDFSCKCFDSPCCDYHRTVPIPSVQEAILNPTHPYIGRGRSSNIRRWFVYKSACEAHEKILVDHAHLLNCTEIID